MFGALLALDGTGGLDGSPYSSSFSVNVVLPASGCEMIANVRRRSISSRKVAMKVNTPLFHCNVTFYGCLLPSHGEHSSITLVFRRHLNYYKKGYKTYFFILL